MIGLMICDDKLSMQHRRSEIIKAMQKLPGWCHVVFVACSIFTSAIESKKGSMKQLIMKKVDNDCNHRQCRLTEQIKELLKMNDKIKELAMKLYQSKSLLIMGRGFNHATCLEAALVSVVVWWRWSWPYLNVTLSFGGPWCDSDFMCVVENLQRVRTIA